MGYYAGLNPLRDVLADIYPVASVARVVVTEAGVAEQLIDWDGAAVEFWKSVLTKAHNNDQVQALIDVARTHFPNNAALAQAERIFHETPMPDFSSKVKEPVENGHVSITIKGDDNRKIAGGDINEIIVYEGEQGYDVHGLKNPYLGLQAFTYAERERYAGREAEVRQALSLLTKPGNERTLLFVTGASGSGKSSFAQAGLLPALESHYQQQGFIVKWAVFRPGEKPLAGLAGALRALNLAAEGLWSPAAEYQIAPITPASPNQISLLVIDQFEELFSQSAVTQRDLIFGMLAKLPPLQVNRLQVIATMRADYLPDLFVHKTLYELAKAGIDLRAMSVEELKVSIQRPLQAFHPDAGKRFQKALLNQLATDAAEDAAYLPLLQMTLDDLWRTGILTIDHYENLTDAIHKRADEIYAYKQDADGRLVHRDQTEQQTILTIFLDLVDVSLEDDIHRDVRRTRRLLDVVRQRDNAASVIQELASARLLTTDRKVLSDSDEEVETVDIIHESLIVNWSQLRNAIQAQREQLQQRRRFELRLDEWVEKKRKEEYLLDGIYLAEAEHLRQIDDVAVRPQFATEFINSSVQQRERQRRREQRITASIIVVLSILLVLATYLGLESQRRAAEAESREGAAKTLLLLDEDPQQSVEIAAHAYQRMQTVEAGDALRQALHAVRLTRTITHSVKNLSRVAFSYDGSLVALANDQHQVEVRKGLDNEVVSTYPTIGRVTSVTFAPANRYWLMAGTEHGEVVIWDVGTGKQLASLLHNSKKPITALAISYDGNYALTGSWHDGTIHLWSLPQGEHIHGWEQETFTPTAFAINPDQTLIAMGTYYGDIVLWDGLLEKHLHFWKAHDSEITELAFSPDGSQLAIASTDRKVSLWDSTNWNNTAPIDTRLLYRLDEHKDSVYHLTYSQNGACLATSGADAKTVVWNLHQQPPFEAGEIVATLAGHTNFILGAAFLPVDEQTLLRPTSRCGQQLMTASVDQTIRIWNIGATSEFRTLVEHNGPVEVVRYSPNGQYLATASGDGTAKVLNATSFKVIRIIEHTDRVYDIEFNADSNLVITASWDGTAKITQIDSGTTHILKHKGPIQKASFGLLNRGTALTAGNDGVLILWDIETRSPLISKTVHSAAIYSIAFNQDGSLVSTAGKDGLAKLLDSNLNEVNQFDHGDHVPYSVQFSPDGDYVVTSVSDGTIRIWPLNNNPPFTLEAHRGSNVFETTFGSIRQQPIMLTSGADGRVKMWTVEMSIHKYEQIGMLPGHLDFVNSVSFYEGQIATSGNDGTVRIYLADLNQYLTER